MPINKKFPESSEFAKQAELDEAKPERPDDSAETNQEKQTSSVMENIPAELAAAALARKPIEEVAVPMEKGVQKIEQALEVEAVRTLFSGLEASQQYIFKQKGEETAEKIRELIDKNEGDLKKAIPKIIEAVSNWLSFALPKERFYRQQIAKIITDNLMTANSQEKL